MKTRNISSWILGGLVFGIIAGFLAKLLPADSQPALNSLVEQIKPLGSLFNRIIFMVVIPIVTCSLISGIATLGGSKIGKISISYYKLATVLIIAAIIVAFSLVLIFKPGHGASYKNVQPIVVASGTKKPILQSLVELVPTNPLEAMVNSANGGLIPVMIFAVFVGFALARSPIDSPLRKLNDEVLAVSIRIVNFAMYVAPLSVAILMFTTIVTTGFALMTSLLSYIAVYIGAMLIQQFVVFSTVLLAASKSPLSFFLSIKEVMATALATASSAVTTPVAMRVAEEDLKLEPEVSRLVLTLGVTGAKSATSIFQIVAILFIAQIAGVELTFNQYAVVGFTAFIAGMVTAGIPSAAIPVIAGVLATIGVPAEAIGLIVSVDRILDMIRTVVNITGNLVIANVVADKRN